jgi:S1-C subfamily serine protease
LVKDIPQNPPISGPAPDKELKDWKVYQVAGSDVVVGLDHETVTGIDDIARILDGSRIDKRVALHVLRDGRVTTVEIVPTERLP